MSKTITQERINEILGDAKNHSCSTRDGIVHLDGEDYILVTQPERSDTKTSKNTFKKQED